jgi:DNA modification methylase
MEEQGKLDIQVEKKMNTVEQYQFEPIKGYPMLHWKGKRPFTSTQFYPAQLKESYGEPVNDWMNKIFWGDNLQVMSHLLKEYRGKVDLIYIDPPFDSKAEYKKQISLKRQNIESDHNSFEEKQYSDIWTNDEYLQFMYERLILLKELLSENGFLFLHCDWHKSHYLRVVLDEVFGIENFRNEIVWCYPGRERASSKKLPSKHDTILFYSKTMESEFVPIRKIWDREERIKSLRRKIHKEEDGSEWFWETRGQANGIEPYKQDLNEYLDKGGAVNDVWDDVQFLRGNHPERENYPTQKPSMLIERIVNACSKPGDIVFDCFMGSGTLQDVAMKSGRKFIGADINSAAVDISIKRLWTSSLKIKNKKPKNEYISIDGSCVPIDNYYTGFSVYNVNNYDVFRNPVEAKEILKEALEIQSLPNNTIYDGEKDGRMVKIMPVNRIATRADLNELISGFNIKSFEKKFETSPNKPVENLLLVCMGHEADLGASLQKEMHPYKLDVEVVDILRDKSNLEFKRDSEAEIKVKDGKLIIEQFYPMNLLQKLSIMKENVEDWKELTESVKVDFNYDGAIFEPKLLDVPEKDEMVKGEYVIPDDAGTIRIKITDLLSESFELTIENK